MTLRGWKDRTRYWHRSYSSTWGPCSDGFQHGAFHDQTWGRLINYNIIAALETPYYGQGQLPTRTDRSPFWTKRFVCLRLSTPPAENGVFHPKAQVVYLHTSQFHNISVLLLVAVPEPMPQASDNWPKFFIHRIDSSLHTIMLEK